VYPRHAGVVVVALRQPQSPKHSEKLTWLLEHVATEKLPGRVFLLRDANDVAYPPLEP